VFINQQYLTLNIITFLEYPSGRLFQNLNPLNTSTTQMKYINCRSTEVCSCVVITPQSFSRFAATILTSVLGSARTGLIFTRIQEGTEPGGLTPPGQTEQGIPYHVPSCWVPMGGSWAMGTHSGGSGARAAIRESSSLGRVVCVVFSPYLYRCCYCSLCLLFC